LYLLLGTSFLVGVVFGIVITLGLGIWVFLKFISWEALEEVRELSNRESVAQQYDDRDQSNLSRPEVNENQNAKQ
jgi:hypothetical protein